jgi:hypothetical protein
MTKKRIQVYADEETKRRVELAAAKHNVAVTEYCLEAIRKQLAEDDMLQQATVEIPIEPGLMEDLVAEIRELSERIRARRDGEPIDVVAIIEQMRAERDDELLGMH